MRPITCESLAGFQSTSTQIILFAPTRFKPVPPDLPFNRKTKIS